MPIPVSTIFGGSAALGGDTATDVGKDAIIVVGSTSGEVFEIDDVMINFGIPVNAPFNNNYDFKAFTSRITIFGTQIRDVFSSNTPNDQLYTAYPREISKSDILFDALIHRGDIPWNLRQAVGTSFGALRSQPGKVISVVVLNPTSYTSGNVVQSIHNIFLHVNARIVTSEGGVRIGNKRAVD